MADILVVYYTRTGHTQKVAEMIIAACDADVERIWDVKPRKGILGYLRSGREAWRREAGDIQSSEKDIDHYDLVIIGTPVWAGNLSSPVRAYVSRYSGRFKRLAAFCTEGGMGGEKALIQLADLCGVEPVTTLVVTEQDIRTGADREMVAGFVESLKK